MNLFNINADSALWQACERGNTEIVSRLLAAPNIDVDMGCKHLPLVAAVTHGYLDILDLLLQAGADVNKVC